MSKHFVPPLPASSSLGKVRYDALNGNDESDSRANNNDENAGHDGSFLSQSKDLITNSGTTGAKHLIAGGALNEDELDDIEQAEWPAPFDDELAVRNNTLVSLPSGRDQILHEVESGGKILVRSITWNQQAKDLPSIEELREHLLPNRYHHVISVGTQECENSISKSILFPAKENWEKVCQKALGDEYALVRGHALQASHLAIFVHKAIFHLVSKAESHAVATGFYDKLGNKGGIAITIKVGKTNMCFLTAHLAAHQHQMERRTEEFMRISNEVTNVLGPKKTSANAIDGDNDYENNCDEDSLPGTIPVASSDNSSEKDYFHDNCLPGKEPHGVSNHSNKDSSRCFCFSPHCIKSGKLCSHCCDSNRSDGTFNYLPDAFDHVIWGGDLNFRIDGTRDIVDKLLAHNQHRILVDNDQLNMVMQFDTAFSGFAEGPLSFPPTYKFDKGTDVYDTSPKRRIPSWTDRILYKPGSEIKLISYSSANAIKSSDHRPVYASFECSLNFEDSNAIRSLLRTESKSQVCVIS